MAASKERHVAARKPRRGSSKSSRPTKKESKDSISQERLEAIRRQSERRWAAYQEMHQKEKAGQRVPEEPEMPRAAAARARAERESFHQTLGDSFAALQQHAKLIRREAFRARREDVWIVWSALENIVAGTEQLVRLMLLQRP